jgi:hypothetical protein
VKLHPQARYELIKTLVVGSALAVFLAGIAACASFGKFSPGTSAAVKDACTVLDSGNPAIGALCLTAEEIASLFGHVRAARAYRAVHPAAGRDAKVDVCEGTP